MDSVRGFRTGEGHLLVALQVVLALRLLLGLAYCVVNPLGEAPDEADHYAYAAYIGHEGALPSGTTITQSKHPPLYHALAAAAASWTGMDFSFLRSNPDGGVAAGQAPNFFIHTRSEDWPWQGGALAMHLGRLVSVLAGVALVLGTYALGRALWPEWPAAGLAGAAVAAFIPESLFIGASMSNDMLSAALCTAALWAGLRRSSKPYLNAVLAGACIGLAFLTKVSTAALAPVVICGLWLQPGSAGRNALATSLALPGSGARPKGSAPKWGGVRGLLAPRRAGPALLASVTATLIAAPWLWRNWRLYGDPLGWPVVLGTVDRRTGPLGLGDLAWLARGWFLSFWGKFGAAGHLSLPPALYLFWIGLLVVAVPGWFRLWLRCRRSGQALAETVSLAGWLALLAAPGLAVVSILSYSQVALGTDQGRLLFPALAPLALLIGGGVAGWWPQNRVALAGIGWAALLAAAATMALVGGIMQPFAPPGSAANAAAAAPQIGATFGSQIELLASRWDAGARQLDLYWQAAGSVEVDLRAALRLTDAEGGLLWEWKRSPGEGRYSTDRWQPGEVIADTYRLPEEELGRAARLEIGVYQFPGETWLLPSGRPADGPFVSLAEGPVLH